MAEMSVIWLRVAAALYSLGLLHAILTLVRRREHLFRVALGAFSLGAVFHFVSIMEEGLINSRCPIGGLYETLSMCAFLLALLYLFVEWRYKVASLSVFVFPLVFVMALLGTLGHPVAAWNNPLLRKTWLTVHIVLVLLGYAALTLTVGASLLYLFQERELKAKKPSKFYYRLPALGTLDELIGRSMAVGFVLMTLAVIAASTWASIYLKSDWIGDPKIVIAFFTWGVYMALVVLRTAVGWRGRKAAWMTLTVLCFSALTWAAHARLARSWRGHDGSPAMKLHLTGVSHKTAPVEIRERLAFREEQLPSALADLKKREGVAEALILSTCNRVEIVVTTDDRFEPESVVDAFLAERKAIDAAAIAPHLYRREGRDAIHHLFRVAASLDSMVVGEPQILGQLKTAYSVAKHEGAVCGWLDGLLARAFGVAKRVRSETGIGQMAVSISYAAVELARKIFGSLASRTVMIVGAGKMSELAARHLRRSGASHVFVTNRTHDRAVEMAQLFQGTPVEYPRFVSMLPEVDILIASSGAPHYILTKQDMQRVRTARRNRPMFLIDIAVPRNIE